MVKALYRDTSGVLNGRSQRDSICGDNSSPHGFEHNPASFVMKSVGRQDLKFSLCKRVLCNYHSGRGEHMHFDVLRPAAK
jgi:hypothetical protein